MAHQNVFTKSLIINPSKKLVKEHFDMLQIIKNFQNNIRSDIIINLDCIQQNSYSPHHLLRQTRQSACDDDKVTAKIININSFLFHVNKRQPYIYDNSA